MEESPLPNAETNRFIFSLLFCCWGYFLFFFSGFRLAVCLSVSIPMTGFSFAYLPARGPANAATVAYSQYVPLYNLRHSVFALRVRDDGSGGGGGRNQ